MLKTAFGRFRLISIIEGLSYLLLVFVAMPIKYIGENPYPVKIVGMGHGVLFILFCMALFHVMSKCKWDKGLGFVYSLIPFGFIIIENAIKKQKRD
jgi:integral membrane protein